MTDGVRNGLQSSFFWRVMKNASRRPGAICAWYRQEGFEVLYLPIPDFGVPTPEHLEQAVQRTIASAQAGPHIAIHCSAGIGRTGLLLALLAKRGFGFSGEEALQWVRYYIPYAVETPEQQRLVLYGKA
jgi:protein-tyrosine phosphatase